MNMIKKYQLEDRVFLLGRIIEYSKLYQILSESDIFIFPTKAELLPFAVLEAMAVGKPVIATNVGGIKEIIVDHVNGILVDALEEKDLPKYIFYSLLELYENKQLRLKIGESARKTIEEKFSLQVIANKLKNEYENTLLRK
jgi:glycosyltransferase involved in cell wall biosynthesis